MLHLNSPGAVPALFDRCSAVIARRLRVQLFAAVLDFSPTFSGEVQSTTCNPQPLLATARGFPLLQVFDIARPANSCSWRQDSWLPHDLSPACTPCSNTAQPPTNFIVPKPHRRTTSHRAACYSCFFPTRRYCLLLCFLCRT